MGVEGRVSIVTGGTRGIGAAISARLVAGGAHVTAVYEGNEQAATATTDRLSGGPGSFNALKANVADARAATGVVQAVIDAHGRIDHLVNNAGLLIESSVRSMSAADWDLTIGVNLSAPFFLAQGVLGPMIEHRFGRIVNISSVTAMMGSPVEAGYGAAKAGLIGLTRSLAREVARRGITVNVVIPGVFETEMTWSMPAAAQEAIRGLIPIGRRGDPDELAHAVSYLLDDDAGYVTGSIVTVDGGLSMGA